VLVDAAHTRRRGAVHRATRGVAPGVMEGRASRSGRASPAASP
jgi:hypothetical protein